ncbi:MAG: cation transporter, partial [Clostridia bacterium]|nr:cation transporter [Deltaproteobacteria bacterium]
MQTHMVMGPHQTASPLTTPAKRFRAALVPVAVSVLLVIAKLFTALLTGSLAVVTSAIDSATDCVSSTLNAIAVRGADKPPDSDHCWGHGKAESLSGLGQAILVSGSAGIVVWQAVERLLHPQTMNHTPAGIAIMIGSLIVSIALGRYLQYAGRASGSAALEGDATHYLSDALTNTAAIVSLIAFRFFAWSWVDPLISFSVACILLGAAFKIGKRAFDELMDRELQDGTRKRIRILVKEAAPEIFGLHALKTRRSGRNLVIEFHLELPAQMSFAEAHQVTAHIEERLRSAFAECMVTIHPE